MRGQVGQPKDPRAGAGGQWQVPGGPPLRLHLDQEAGGSNEPVKDHSLTLSVDGPGRYKSGSVGRQGQVTAAEIG